MDIKNVITILDKYIQKLRETHEFRKHPHDEIKNWYKCERCYEYSVINSPLKLCSKCQDYLKNNFPEVYEEARLENMQLFDLEYIKTKEG